MNILVAGTSVVDVFFRADPHHFSASENTVTFKLGDKVPIETEKMAVGGNAANVAISLSRLEIPTLLYTYLGGDVLAQKIRNTISQEGVEVLGETFPQETSPLHLICNFNSDRIIFSDYTSRHYTFSYTSNIQPDCIYLTSIGDTWKDAYQHVLDFQQKHNIPLAFSPGSRQLGDMDDLFFTVVSSATYLSINKEEASLILKKVEKNDSTIEDTLRSLSDMGPKIVSVTDGKHGAYAYDKTMYKISPFRDKKPLIQKTGAGDSYAAAFLAAHLLKNPLSECMRWGALNAHGVMQHLGAQDGLLTQRELKTMLDNNSDFKAETL